VDELISNHAYATNPTVYEEHRLSFMHKAVQTKITNQ